MAWLPMGGSITLNGSSELSAVQPNPGAEAFTTNLQTAVGSSLDDSAYKYKIPSLDIDRVVAAKTSLPTPVQDAQGVTYLDDDAYHHGNLVIDKGEELLLRGADLYVDGDLTIRGTMHGNGGIVATGDVTVEGGNGIVSIGNAGTKVLSGGETTLVGRGSSAYVPSSEISTKTNQLQLAIDAVILDPGNAAKRADAMTAANSLQSSLSAEAATPETEQTIQYAQDMTNSLQAFENYLNRSASVQDLTRIGLDPTKVKPRPQGATTRVRRRRALPSPSKLVDFLELNQGGFGKGHFQGIAYSVGDITISDGFKVVGSVITRGKADLKGGVDLLFNEEYVKEEPGRVGNFAVLSYEER